ncbi:MULTISPECIES: hypothetical protein [Chryseobacterium]|uniref:Uncharacterized protein n=1 Tax=Chryseobacterium caseinilyticum TaxID=2771428 RepID=A0ABR8ZE41_9FLAO|nr:MULTISPECIES: hypothetical protein [Chryseobacterium]KQS93512.1 hypothetical protein ASG21_00640 [Chryseobacterium sp. Leaf394]MBD8083555.1 hypothetical protein [Chryseobacterium caseinilyticum]
MKTVTKSIAISLVSLFTLAFFLIVGLVFYERNYSAKFKNTSLNITQDIFIKTWGRPDKIKYCKDCNDNLVLFYYTPLTYYAFNFDKKTKLLINKYQD